MARPTIVPRSQDLDPRLYCDYAQLVRLQSQAMSFSLLPHLKAGSVLSGRHHSLFRGRGLNFEELRHYQRGDDIRNLDWKVTLRTGKPHVRTYTEEKDRNVMLCVDQRSSMFFSSTSVMKSVVAAEIAAMCAWRILKDGDRVGFLIADSQHLHISKSQRSQHGVLRQLRLLSQVNQSLSVASQDGDQVGFSRWLYQLGRMRLKQSTLVIISDWHDCDESMLEQLKQWQQHNDVLAVQVSDPFEQALPPELAGANWVIGDGTYQMNLDSHVKIEQASRYLHAQSGRQRDALRRLMAIKRLPHIELDTRGGHLGCFRQAVGERG
ncbi:MoxR protein [Photobacterium aquae]|uniref:MoxR protein n=1 Tax=Photobacterium aquae TaxID=1195763 RepID=A0A0J1JP80_9GAMM|nr:DUF58 domain-containing protein [Photobacterium aquae]KLV04017.1 MoxR protein [Photobacterium aquae]